MDKGTLGFGVKELNNELNEKNLTYRPPELGPGLCAVAAKSNVN